MQRCEGFSLLELMVVLAVMAILSAMAIPGFSLITQKAKESSVKSVAHMVQVGLETVVTSEGQYPVGSYDGAGLGAVLVQKKALKALPKNPFTGQPYTATDTSGKLVYVCSDPETGYTLTAYGKNNETPILELKSE